MPASHSTSLALIVQGSPYRDRVARVDVDMAIAAATLDFNVRIYFQGLSVMQLIAQRNPSEALLPKGYRAWAALPDLGSVRFFAERQWLDHCLAGELTLVLAVEALSDSEMRRSWRSCDHVLVL